MRRNAILGAKKMDCTNVHRRAVNITRFIPSRSIRGASRTGNYIVSLPTFFYIHFYATAHAGFLNLKKMLWRETKTIKVPKYEFEWKGQLRDYFIYRGQLFSSSVTKSHIVEVAEYEEISYVWNAFGWRL